MSDKTLRILHVAYYYLPWLGYDVALAEEQDALGHQTLFAASSRIPKSKKNPGKEASSYPDRIDNVLLWTLAFGSRIILMPGIIKTLYKFRPNVVHCHVVFDLTASPLYVALMVILRFLPMVFLGFHVPSGLLNF